MFEILWRVITLAATINANERKDLRHSATKEIREKGLIPAVVYGKDREPTTISVDSIELLKTVRDEGRNAVLSLQVEGDTVDVMLHDYQVDPVKDKLLHADFYAVNMSQEMDVNVPIRLEGEAQGARDGGVVQQPLYELSVRAKPRDIPEEITIDVSELGVGDSLLVSDLKGASSYEILEDENTTIVTVLVPDEEPEETVEEEPTEPELVDGEDTDEASEGSEENNQ